MSKKSINDKTELDPKLVRTFCSDAGSACDTLREALVNGNIRLFTTTAHAMKNASASVGGQKVSELAADLENAGESGDADFIAANTDAFIKLLESFVSSLKVFAAGETDAPDAADGVTDELAGAADPSAADANAVVRDAVGDTGFLKEQLEILKNSCEAYDVKSAYAAVDRLKKKTWDPKTSEYIEEIHETLYSDSDFEKAAEMAQEGLGD